MEQPVIQVEGLSKKFIIAHQKQERYTALRDIITNNVKSFFSKSNNVSANINKEEFWALKDIDFNINQGDRVGIIGRNGAGKSTLLKILSRITEPSTGRVTLRGRVASLLEVGTGFHPELTGRENIFLNGAILGMTRQEIKTKFDEIVAFAEVEKFLDTPVKRYSSGMYVRLAFAVAAHLDPEILIVDEVLAVGDAQFQKKCLGKMEEVSKNEGRTVLFVSHNMAAVKTLCSKAIILDQGKKILEGDVFECLERYFSFNGNKAENAFNRSSIPANQKMYISGLKFFEDNETVDFRIDLAIEIISQIDTRICINIRLKDGMGFPVAYGNLLQSFPELIEIEKGTNNIQATTMPLKLAAGTYKISLELVIPGVEYLDKVEDCLVFELSNDSASVRKYAVAQDWGYGSMEIEFDKIITNSLVKNKI